MDRYSDIARVVTMNTIKALQCTNNLSDICIISYVLSNFVLTGHVLQFVETFFAPLRTTMGLNKIITTACRPETTDRPNSIIAHYALTYNTLSQTIRTTGMIEYRRSRTHITWMSISRPTRPPSVSSYHVLRRCHSLVL